MSIKMRPPKYCLFPRNFHTSNMPIEKLMFIVLVHNK